MFFLWYGLFLNRVLCGFRYLELMCALGRNLGDDAKTVVGFRDHHYLIRFFFSYLEFRYYLEVL